MQSKRTTRDGITVRHARSCPAYADGNARCRCKRSYQAQVWSDPEQKRITRSFPTRAAAKAWRQDALVGLRQGTISAERGPTVREAGDEYVTLARAGIARTRSGDPYKPSAVRGIEEALRLRWYPEVGAARLTEVRRSHIQRIVNGWLAKGLSPSTIRNSMNALRAIYRRALTLDDVMINPTRGVELPAVRGRRERVATAPEAAALIAAAPEEDRALWATAFYAGPRHGELRALEWERHVDLNRNLLVIEAGWDRVEGLVTPKSRAGVRTIPIIPRLRAELLGHALLTGRREGLVFGRSAEIPFAPSSVQQRADKAWGSAGLERLTLHDCRHTFASLMIAAQVRANEFNPKVLQRLMGHSSIQVTYDRYGHLFPGSEEAAAAALEAFLAAAP
jgi:integrase